MKAWLEALTGKQALLMTYLTKYLRERDCDVIVTTRNYDYAVGIFRNHGIEPIVIGRYGGLKLKDKLISSLKRQMKLVDIISKEKIDVHISFTSPDSCRVAFGLGIPIIQLSDSPHSVFVNKLTVPLSEYLVIPKCIPKEDYSRLIDPNKIVQFNGFFELVWIKRIKPKKEVLEKFSLEERNYIVVRTEESKASYYPKLKQKPTVLDRVLKKTLDLTDIKVVIFPRYDDQKKYLYNVFKEYVDRGRVIIVEKATDSLSLSYFSLAVVTGGSTFAQEAALMGVPSISYFPYHFYVEEEISKQGFPLFHIPNTDKCSEKLYNIVEEKVDYRAESMRKILGLEDPLDVIVKLIYKLK